MGVGSILPHSTIEKHKGPATGGSPMPRVCALCVCVLIAFTLTKIFDFALLLGKITNNAISKKNSLHYQQLINRLTVL